MKKYIVIKANTAGLNPGEYLAVGEEVELSDKQAAARVNKVRLLADKPAKSKVEPEQKPEAAPAKSSRKSRSE